MDHFPTSSTLSHRRPEAAELLLPGGSEPATRWMRGRLDEVLAWMPDFQKQPFDLRRTDHIENPLRSLVVRVASNYRSHWAGCPVGVVSNHYQLVGHREVGRAMRRALSDVGIAPDGLDTHVTLDRFGARCCLQITLPASLMMHPGDGNPMVLQFRAYNSVDGSSSLRFAMVWYRLVCTNGLLVGTSTLGDAFAHREGLDLNAVDRFLSSGMALARLDGKSFGAWERTPAPEAGWHFFADGPLKNTWGAMTAARWLSIMRSGRDARPWDAFEKALPSARKMVLEDHVPGSPKRGATLWHTAQALSWVTRTRADLLDQLDRLRDIPWLIEQLGDAAHSRPAPARRQLH